MTRKKQSVALTIRLPGDVYEAAKEAVQADAATSLDEFVAESLRASIRAREHRRLYDSFTELGKELQNEAEFAFEAQREAVGDD